VGERLHKYLFWLPLPLLGFDPLMIFTVMAINLFYQFWLHTEWVRRLPRPVEAIFNTPSHHRVHHGSNIDYLDANHGGMLIIWDRLFGTFVPEQDSQPVTYGLTTNISNFNPFYVAFHDYAALIRDLWRAKRWSDRWKYCVLSPGWSHDGPDRRSAVLKQRAREAGAHAQGGIHTA
jgi:sterol desaturase/sphingolipid hydroxylase (fatty acid hydroxylase superfamily)